MTTIFRIEPDASISMVKTILTQMESWSEETEVNDAIEISESAVLNDTLDANTLIPLLFGSTAYSMDSVNSLNLDPNGYLICNEYFTTWDSFNDAEVLSDTFAFDDTTVFDDTVSISELFHTFSNLTISTVPVDKVTIFNNKIGAKQFKQNQIL